MNILKRQIAPISTEAWKEIDEEAIKVIKSIITTRKTLMLNGPKGWNYTAVPTGRLIDLDSPKDENSICTGIYEIQNLVEARTTFELNKWELDNIQRGAKDIDFDNLYKAVEELVLFEEKSVYHGYEKSNIKGLCETATNKLNFGKNGNEILKNIGDAKYMLYNAYIRPPFNLIVSPEFFDTINILYDGGNLIKNIEKLIEGKVIRSKILKGALLLPVRNEDLELTIGQDFSIGFEKELEHTVKLFVTESFTFRCLDNDKVIYFENL